MSDSIPAQTEQVGAKEHVHHPTRARARPQPCRFCADENVGDVVDAGGDVGRVHRACFIEWDRRQEGHEAVEMVALSLPDPRECWSELEIAGDDALARAA